MTLDSPLAMDPSYKRDSMDATTDVASKLETTHLHLSQPPSVPPVKDPASLTSVPAAIRNKIYAHLLDTELVNTGLPNVSYTHTLTSSTLHFRASRAPFPVHTALFYVNKCISKEARRFFYSKNLFVRLEIYSADARHAKTMLEDSGVLFSVAGAEVVERCKGHALNLRIVEKGSSVRRASVLFPAQYLPRWLNFCEQASKASGSWASSHALFLSVLDVYGMERAKVQGDLLELFRLLTGMGKVEVVGAELLEGYAEGLQESMMKAKFEPDAWFALVSEMTLRAEKAHEKGNYDTAAQHAHAAIISMTFGYLTRAETLHSQPESFTKNMQRLRWRTELTLASTLHAKHADGASTTSLAKLAYTATPSPSENSTANALLAAESAASHALSLATDSPSPASNPWFRSLPPELIPPNKPDWFTDEQRGQSWYMLGLVHLAVGECLFAAGDLERAVELLGQERKGDVEKAFESAREGIDWDVRPGVGLGRAAWVARREVV